MSFLNSALELARLGFHVFPLLPDSKVPAIDDFPNRASRDEKTIREWWTDPVLEIEQPFNVGISTTKFSDGESLVVVDVDNKEGKDGNGQILKLELDGRAFPETFEQETPSGGRHLVYRTDVPVKQGANVLGEGVDIRSRGGYVAGAGSRLEGRAYAAHVRPVQRAPEWLVSHCGRSEVRVRPAAGDGRGSGSEGGSAGGINFGRAERRAIHYLTAEAPVSIEGQGGDQTAFAVAARVKDFGVDEPTCLELLLERWNPMCEPPWSLEELEKKVQNAYAYGANKPGSDAPELLFPEIEEKKELHPFDVLNQEYAYIGGNKGIILHETKDPSGRFAIEYIPVPTFHLNLTPYTMNFGDL